jgi:hypothetical protein
MATRIGAAEVGSLARGARDADRDASRPDRTGTPRIVAIADSESSVAWGAALLAGAPEEWDRSLFVLASPVLPSGERLAAALTGAFADGSQSPAPPVVVDLATLAERIAAAQPDVLLLCLRTSLVPVTVGAIVGSCVRRPVIVTGLPDICIPATGAALAYRTEADLVVLHSRREVREFTALAARTGLEQRFALATLPFLPRRSPGQRADGDVVFAAQARVPRDRADRLALLGWLAESARRHPYRRVIVMGPAAGGPWPAPAEGHDYAALLDELVPRAPSNLVVAGGVLDGCLARAAGLVTVSSTAVIAAVSLDVPALVLHDFGVGEELGNVVFADSGLFGGSGDLVEARFRRARPGWTDDNYFHPAQNNDWIEQLRRLLALRDAGLLPPRPASERGPGGALRLAWDRKRALGRFDRSLAGFIALVVGTLPRLVVALVRRARSRRAAS